MIEKSHQRFTKNLIPYLVLGIAPLCWAGNIVLARGMADTIPPVAFAFWRWTLALALILPFTLRQVALDWTEITRRWRRLFLLAALGISGFNTLLYTAVHTTTAINGALIQTSMPAVIVLLSWLMYRENVTGRQLKGVFLCLLGAGLFINLLPAFASLLSVWLLDESIRWFHIGGMGLIAGGMIVFYRARA